MIDMNYNMLIVLVVFTVLVIYDLQKLIKNKDSIKVLISYIVIVASSLAVGLLLALGKRPVSPSEWIEWIFKMIGVVK